MVVGGGVRMIQVYQVVGGWHARDAELRMACFGRTQDEAKTALDLARKQAAQFMAQASKKSSGAK